MTSARRLHLGHAILLLLALLVLALGWRAVVQSQPSPRAMPPLAPPLLTDRALLARTDPFFGGTGGDTASLPVTALPFSLHGIRTDSATGQGSAIIAGADGEQKIYAVSDDLGGGVTLAAIALDHVVLDRSGTRELLWLDAAGNAPVQQFTPADAPPPRPDYPGEPPPPDVPARAAPRAEADLPAIPQDAEGPTP